MHAILLLAAATGSPIVEHRPPTLGDGAVPPPPVVHTVAPVPTPAFAAPFAVAAPVETFREPAATPAQQLFARRLRAQGGVRGREPVQGWTITD